MGPLWPPPPPPPPPSAPRAGGERLPPAPRAGGERLPPDVRLAAKALHELRQREVSAASAASSRAAAGASSPPSAGAAAALRMLQQAAESKPPAEAKKSTMRRLLQPPPLPPRPPPPPAAADAFLWRYGNAFRQSAAAVEASCEAEPAATSGRPLQRSRLTAYAKVEPKATAAAAAAQAAVKMEPSAGAAAAPAPAAAATAAPGGSCDAKGSAAKQKAGQPPRGRRGLPAADGLRWEPSRGVQRKPDAASSAAGRRSPACGVKRSRTPLRRRRRAAPRSPSPSSSISDGLPRSRGHVVVRKRPRAPGHRDIVIDWDDI